jgi:hypothetical protein
LVLGALPLSRFLRQGGDFDFLTSMRMVENNAAPVLQALRFLELLPGNAGTDGTGTILSDEAAKVKLCCLVSGFSIAG